MKQNYLWRPFGTKCLHNYITITILVKSDSQQSYIALQEQLLIDEDADMK